MSTQKCERCEYRAETRIKDYCNNPDSPNYLKTPIINQKACPATKQKPIQEITTIHRMRCNARAYNKHITKAFLRTLTPKQLLHYVHETDRKAYAVLLYKEHHLSSEDVQEYLDNNSK